MKIESQKTIDKNGKVLQHFANHFNAEGLVERKEYLNTNGEVVFYSIFNYDTFGNWIMKKEYDSNGESQVSFEREFDILNREIKSIELTAENKIWQWHEKSYPNDNTIIYLSKDENGQVDHKTIENTVTNEQKRFRSGDLRYATIKKIFDKKNRLINQKTFDISDNVIEENQYSYIGASQFWKLFINGKCIKSEERKSERSENLKYYIRKDKNGKALEWSKSKFDYFNNLISIEGGKEVGKPTYKTSIKIKYLENENAH
ncbi:MAG: hypothetical protein GQ574_11145 [Crocinitomix sp.]|nr:hypothetical protein [Crocinitomix sp.]